jgi:alpha-1,3-glucosyltransferase
MHRINTATVFKFLFFSGSLLKFLLIPAYRSTDFEVHRNWLAITFSQPLHLWYGDASKSEWTLDYPPFFAYFEWAMAQVAYYVDPGMLDVANLNYASTGTVLFQRTSVIVTDVVFIYSLYLFSLTWPSVRLTETAHSYSKTCIVTALAFLNPGLLMVDHVHFQYNGVMVGIFIVSLALIRKDCDLRAAGVFACLLCMKHIFLYVAPVYLVYLYRHHCYDLKAAGCSVRRRMPAKYNWNIVEDEEIDQSEEHPRDGEGRPADSDTNVGLPVDSTDGENTPSEVEGGPATDFDTEEERERTHAAWSRERSPSLEVAPKSLGNCKLTAFLELGGVVLVVVAVAFLPILVAAFLKGGDEQVIVCLQQIFGRLFPFQRGLTHAYWAPNVWAGYNLLDKVLVVGLKRYPGILNTTLWGRGILDALSDPTLSASTTSGLVGVVAGHRVLPTITGGICLLATVVAMLPILLSLWRRPHPKAFVHAIVFCQMCAFQLGYHVHEKAILIAILPMTLLACDSAADAKVYLLMAWIGHVSLFPLLYGPREAPLQLLAFVIHAVGGYLALDSYHKNEEAKMRFTQEGVTFSRLEKLYLWGLGCVCMYQYLHPVLWPQGMEFLPLMLMSVYCAMGNMYVWYLIYDLYRKRDKLIEAYVI